MSGDCYYGVYRGRVERVNDPEKRFRYRVRVYTVHDESIFPDNLPWAETGFCFNGTKSKLAADIPNFDIGDLVWIMFEGGDRRFPVVTGGWISHRIGINDVPADQAEDYNRTRKRWQRIDRVGNLIEVSELEDELHIKLQSGGAELFITQRHNSILLKSTGGVIRVEAPKAEIVAAQAIVDSKEVTIRAALDDSDNPADEKGRAYLLAHKEVNVHAQNPLDTTEGVVNLGGFTPTQDGVIVPSAPPKQSPDTRVRSLKIHIGERDGTPDGPHTRPVTMQVEIHGAEYVKIDSPALVDIRTTEDGGIINVVNEGDGDINIDAEGGGDVNIESEEAKVNVTGSVEVNLKSTDAGGKANMEGQTLVFLKSDVKIKLEAPSIDIG